jgi:hypothetical protein
MSGFTDLTAKAILNYTTGQVATAALPSVWVGLFTTAPTSDAATSNGSTEVSGGSYARVQVAGQLAASSAATTVITFGATPAWVVAGMSVNDVTTPANVPANTTVVSVTGTTVTCSNTVSGVGTDTIRFSAFTPASGSAPSSVTTGSVITFPAATASWGTVTSFGLFDAATVGNLLDWDYNGNFSWLPATVSSASPGVLTAHAHGYGNGDSFVFSTEYGGTAPTFSAGNYTGIQTVAGVATDTFNVTGVNTSATGNGLVRKVIQQVVSSGVTVSFAAAALTITSA